MWRMAQEKGMVALTKQNGAVEMNFSGEARFDVLGTHPEDDSLLIIDVVGPTSGQLAVPASLFEGDHDSMSRILVNDSLLQDS